MPSHMLPLKLPLKPINKSIAAFKNYVRQQNRATTQRSVSRICLMTNSPMPTPGNAQKPITSTAISGRSTGDVTNPQDLEKANRATKFVMVRDPASEDTMSSIEATCERLVPLKDILRRWED